MVPAEQQAYELRHLRFQGVRAARHRARPSVRPGPRSSLPSTRPASEPSEPPHEFIEWLLNQAGLNAKHYRAQPLQRRLAACLRLLRVSTPEAARERLHRQPELLHAALGSVLLGVTEFFRDPAVFDTLRDLLSRRPEQPGGLRVWSAACSDGSEVYSVAVLLAELGLLDGSELLGTDCRPEAICQARSARYCVAGLQNVPMPLQQQYFEAEGECFRVVDRLRSHVRFEVQDLFRQIPPGPWDVILWRNAAIYLNPPAAHAVWRRLAEQLRPGGILIAGKADQPESGMSLTRIAANIYLRAENRT